MLDAFSAGSGWREQAARQALLVGLMLALSPLGTRAAGEAAAEVPSAVKAQPAAEVPSAVEAQPAAVGPPAAAAQPPDHASPVRVIFHVEAGVAEVHLPDRRLSFPIGGGDSLRSRLAAFRRECAGPSSAGLAAEARRLGSILLEQAPKALRHARRWQVTPLDCAPLSALVPPWSPDAEPLVVTTAISYLPRGSLEPEPSPRGRRGGLLVVAPFTPGVPPLLDDPDTLLWALRRKVAGVDLVPRNDTTLDVVAAALTEGQYALLLVRAAPPIVRPLLPSLVAGPPLAVWIPSAAGPGSWAGRRDSSSGSGPRERLEVLRRWAMGGRTVAGLLWPVAPRWRREGAVAFARNLSEGHTALDALQRARASMRRSGAPLREWAGWILVGSADGKVRLERPSLLRRLLRRLQGPRGGDAGGH